MALRIDVVYLRSSNILGSMPDKGLLARIMRFAQYRSVRLDCGRFGAGYTIKKTKNLSRFPSGEAHY
jgi:hypothetical protein